LSHNKAWRATKDWVCDPQFAALGLPRDGLYQGRPFCYFSEIKIFIGTLISNSTRRLSFLESQESTTEAYKIVAAKMVLEKDGTMVHEIRDKVE